MWGNVNYYKSVYHPNPTLPARIRSTLAIFKTNQYVLYSAECGDIFSSWPNWRGEKGLFWRVQEGRGITLWDYPQEHFIIIRDWKVSPFGKFEIILTFLCFSLDSLTNKHCRTWSSMINLWIDSRIYLELSKQNVLGNMMLSHWPCFAWKLFMTWFHNF